jgi:hypothetical protein
MAKTNPFISDGAQIPFPSCKAVWMLRIPEAKDITVSDQGRKP